MIIGRSPTYLPRYPLCVQPGTELDYNKVRGVVVRVVPAVVAQRVVDLESQLTSGEVEGGAPHVTKEHLHRDLSFCVGRCIRRESLAFRGRQKDAHDDFGVVSVRYPLESEAASCGVHHCWCSRDVIYFVLRTVFLHTTAWYNPQALRDRANDPPSIQNVHVKKNIWQLLTLVASKGWWNV